MQGGGGPAEPTAERHPQSDPSEKLTIAVKQSELTDGVKATAKGGEPAPVRASETGRARNWTMPPLRLEREWRERTNSATIDNRCVEFDRRENQRCAFTMAEILLSLTIIGVVASITLPSLTGNINERTWNTQRKALYARMSQAIALMPALNGYGKLSGTISDDGSQSVTEDTAAETFVTDGLSKVLKINNICDNEHLEDCGLASKITNIKGDSLDFPFDMKTLNSGILSQNFVGHPSYNQLNTKAAAFETQNGESIAVYYNPNCSINQAFTNYWNYVQPLFCANFLYDLNGSKGPNTVGKDLGFITVFYAVDPMVVAPVPLMQNAATGVSQIAAGKECLKFSDDSRVPNKEELAAMYINKELIGNWDAGGFYLSSSTDIYEGAPAAWTVDINHGTMYKTSSRTQGHALRCIKR